MILAREFLVCFFDLVVRGSFFEPKDFVVIAFLAHDTTLLLIVLDFGELRIDDVVVLLGSL